MAVTKILAKNMRIDRLINYIVNTLGGVVTAEQYGEAAGRITILQDPVSAFSDVDANAWYAPAVRYVARNEIMIGTAADAFAPQAEVSYAMVMKLIADMAGADTAPRAGEPWYESAVAWAEENGIAEGIAEGAQPGDPCKRERSHGYQLCYGRYVRDLLCHQRGGGEALEREH